MRKTALLTAAATLLLSCASSQSARSGDLASWIAQTEDQAIAEGVTPAVVHEALDSFEPNARVVELDQKQPESTLTFARYRHNMTVPARVRQGSVLLRRYQGALAEIEQRTGVPPQIIVALWGMESGFGRDMGNFQTVNSLATLAYEGRRADFFRGELIAALHILDREHIPVEALRGSWAGAMGQCQFMPSTYLKYAVDGDGDGRRDIWGDPLDVMASIATYLAAEGWQRDQTWGREVTADAVDSADVGLAQSHLLTEWSDKGVTNLDGSPLPQRPVMASLLQPDGASGDSFLAYDNIRVLMRWNHSTYFALSAGILADEMAKN